MRISPILAIAHRDIRCELSARQRGWILLGITGLLLLPLASVPSVSLNDESEVFYVTGAVPEHIQNTPGVIVVEGPAHMGLIEDERGLLAIGQPPPQPLREALDKGGPKLEWLNVSPERPMPKRSLLFALVASSVLTGALSESISGERSQRTLQALLAAAITRLELVTGKWLAWAGYGATAATLAALVSLIVGTTHLGWWLLTLPVVPATTVALGLYMVRHASDRVSGATISLRILPALLAILAITAWFLGGIHPILGALVPLGGALIATGQVWAGPLPAIVSSLSAIAVGGLLLSRTASQLEQTPPSNRAQKRLQVFGIEFGLAALLWWMPILGSLIWANAGNQPLTEAIGAQPGVIAASLMVGIAAWIHLNQPQPERKTDARSIPLSIRLTVMGFLLVAFCSLLFPNGLMISPPSLTGIHERLFQAHALTPFGIWLGFVLIPLQEWYFRGRLVDRLGKWGAISLYVLIVHPLNPLMGLVLGLTFVYTNQWVNRGLWPSILIRWMLLVLMTWTTIP